MRTLYLAAALLMASSAAHAGNSFSFQIDGQTIHIQAPRNCTSLSCVEVTAPGLNLKNLKSKGGFDDDSVSSAPAPAPATPATAPPPAQATATPAPAAGTPLASSAPAPTTTLASTTPAPVLHDVAPNSSVTPATSAAPQPVAAVTAPPAQPPAQASATPPVTPLGVWATEDGKGNVRIEPCGSDLCGYAADSGERILINMKPADSKWTGKIHDPDSGRTYDSTIAMRGPNTLKVQGCAFGGLFCGGQTWKRIS